MRRGVNAGHMGALVMSVALGCAERPHDGASASPQGRERRGSFSFACDAPLAGICGAGEVATTFPEEVGVGARFHLIYRRNGRLEDGPDVRLVSPSLVKDDGHTFVARRPGTSAFFVEDVGGAVMDQIGIRFADQTSPDREGRP